MTDVLRQMVVIVNLHEGGTPMPRSVVAVVVAARRPPATTTPLCATFECAHMPPVVRVHARSRPRADDNVDHEHMPSGPAITFIRPEQLTTKAPYAYAAVTGPGQLVFTAGACPLDADGNTIAVGDVAGPTHQVIANLVAALQAAGAQLTDVVKTTIYVASSQQSDLGTARHVVRAAFGEHDAPSTCSASASWATTTS